MGELEFVLLGYNELEHRDLLKMIEYFGFLEHSATDSRKKIFDLSKNLSLTVKLSVRTQMECIKSKVTDSYSFNMEKKQKTRHSLDFPQYKDCAEWSKMNKSELKLC